MVSKGRESECPPFGRGCHYGPEIRALRHLLHLVDFACSPRYLWGTEARWVLTAHQARRTWGLHLGSWNLAEHSAILCLSFPICETSVKAGLEEGKTRDCISCSVDGETEAQRRQILPQARRLMVACPQEHILAAAHCPSLP